MIKNLSLKPSFLCVFLSIICLGSSKSSAEEGYPFVVEGYPPHIEERLKYQYSSLQIASIGNQTEYFISKLKTWDKYSEIKVCFFEGTAETRSRIAQIANEWSEAATNLAFDFGDISDPRMCTQGSYNHIRVGFQYKGYWSLVGTDSVRIAAQNEQSLNLMMFNINPPPEPEFSKIVLHEFGHAIGLQHEHQSFNAPCEDEFDWEKIYIRLSGPPNYWSKNKVDHNLRPIISSFENAASDFDRESIMLYAFPSDFYSAGDKSKCFIKGNYTISDKDKEAIQTYYPDDIEEAKEVRENALNSFYGAIDEADLTEIEKSSAKLHAASIARTGTSQYYLETMANGPYEMRSERTLVLEHRYPDYGIYEFLEQ